MIHEDSDRQGTVQELHEKNEIMHDRVCIRKVIRLVLVCSALALILLLSMGGVHPVVLTAALYGGGLFTWKAADMFFDFLWGPPEKS